MDVDAGHIDFGHLAQAIPPVFAALLFGQAAMYEAHRRFGVPMITHDQKMLRPVWAKRTISSWLVGAGADHVEAGMEFVPAETTRVPSAEGKAPMRPGEVRATDGGDCTVDGTPPFARIVI